MTELHRPPASSPAVQSPPRPRGDAALPEDLGHPRGTLAIVIVFGLLFALGWLAMYVYGFLQRGAPRS